MLDRPLHEYPPRILAVLPLIVLFSAMLWLDGAEAKKKPAYRPQPELRILSITLSPPAYSPRNGSLDLAIEVELPRDLDDATILEVSSFISSPSKRSMRFLSNRRPVGAPQQPASVSALQTDSKPRIAVVLTWDGKDQSKQMVENGTYQYEVRAKLLTVGEKGPKTQMTSWPRRGILEVK